MQVVIYEDGDEGRLGPLAMLRPVFDLRCGALLLREKLELRRPDWTVALAPRTMLAALVEEEHPGRGVDSIQDSRTLFLSASVVVDDELLQAVDAIADDCALVADGVTVGAVVSKGATAMAAGSAPRPPDPKALGLPERADIPLRMIRRPWHVVRMTPEEMERDAALLPGSGVEGAVHERATLISPDRISIGPNSRVAPGVVIDASRGRVIVGSEVTIMASAYLEGPVFVGDGSLVRPGARIYGGTSIGPVCKVGGEISGSVLQSHSNKQHDGFLGHSHVGSWVNLGAGTDTSDLRNDYGAVRVTIGEETCDTGLLSVGSIIGDHTKTAIGTRLNTGSVVGVFCSVFPGAFPPSYLPPFSWGTQDGFVRYDIERAIETARAVMARRGVELSAAREQSIRSLYESVAA